MMLVKNANCEGLFQNSRQMFEISEKTLQHICHWKTFFHYLSDIFIFTFYFIFRKEK